MGKSRKPRNSGDAYEPMLRRPCNNCEHHLNGDHSCSKELWGSCAAWHKWFAEEWRGVCAEVKTAAEIVDRQRRNK